MYKTTHKNKNHFASLCTLTLIVLFISAFTEVNAQSSSKTSTTPVAVQPTDQVTPQAVLNLAPAPDASEDMVNERKMEQPDPASTVMPETSAAVEPEAPAAIQEKKQVGKKQPK